MRTEYSVKINTMFGVDELPVKDEIRVKDFTSFSQVEELVKSGKEFRPEWLVTLDVHNEKSENTDYAVYVFRADDGSMYYTSSESLVESLVDIIVLKDRLIDSGEPWAVVINEFKSKNNTGSFYKAVLV